MQIKPISFHKSGRGCPGKRRLSGFTLLGLCISCARLGRPGEQIEPPARIVCGQAQCIEYVDGELAHCGVNVRPTCAIDKPLDHALVNTYMTPMGAA